MTAYATVADMRAEGVTVEAASDARLERLLEEASRTIDGLTGWVFAPRPMTLRLSGRGVPTIEPPYHPLRVDRVRVAGSEMAIAWDVPVDGRHLLVIGAPVHPGFTFPSITLAFGRVFPKGHGNVEVTGLWGYTEDDGTPLGATPAAIRRATMRLALADVTPLAQGDARAEVRRQARLLEERTRDQSYRLAPPTSSGVELTGDTEVDAILTRYRRPGGLGGA